MIAPPRVSEMYEIRLVDVPADDVSTASVYVPGATWIVIPGFERLPA